MTKVCILGWYHHKNLEFLHNAFNILNWQQTSFEQAEVVFSGNQYIDIENYPLKKFILGPHFCVLPNETVKKFNNIHNNAIYIQPSQQCVELWADELEFKTLHTYPFAFGVNTDKFNERSSSDDVFVYFKHRNPEDLKLVTNFLNSKGVTFKIFNYDARYNESDYLSTLNQSKYGIWIGSHESQGFALEEALSCDVPLLVWNVKLLSQEYNCSRECSNLKTPFTTTPYWNETCGKHFYSFDELEQTFKVFLNEIPNYQPRKFILDNLSVQKRTEALKDLINF